MRRKLKCRRRRKKDNERGEDRRRDGEKKIRIGGIRRFFFNCSLTFEYSHFHFQVNIAQFHPVPGNGIVYGTKRGKVKVFYRNNYEMKECSAGNDVNSPDNCDGNGPRSKFRMLK